jgi:hypothetical protein
MDDKRELPTGVDKAAEKKVEFYEGAGQTI